ncbi:MAG TPA: ATP-binding protein [Stellaceae bacterium]|nr:ATP-binding protein [Stellaceae bacterium]
MPSGRNDAAAWPGEAGPELTPGDMEIRQRRVLKRLLPQSMFGRSLLLIVMPLVLLQIIATWIFYDRHWEAVSYRFSADVAGDVAMVIDAMQTADTPAERDHLFQRTAAESELIFGFRPGATLPAGEPFDDSMLETKLRQTMTSRVHQPFTIDDRSRAHWVLVGVQLPDGVLHVDVPLSRLYTPTTYIFILWMIGSSVVLLAVAALFLRNQVRSLRRLAAAAEGFGKGRPIAFTKLEGAREVRQAGAAFMQMRDRIERQIRQRTEMLAGVSHDLRTPLTRMKLALELLPDESTTAELKSDVTDMERLIHLYLDFARGEGTETPVETDLGLLLEEMAAAARRDGTPLAVAEPPELIIQVRPNALRRCLGNLLANARQYGSQVWLSSEAVADGIDIVVDDDGPGIAVTERERVFRPFIRLDASRNPRTGGVGLGLTIARDVARSHGGDVRLEDSPYGGLRARLHLPR